MSDDEGTLEEKRIFAKTDEKRTLFVATGAGVARVSVSGDFVGGFALEHQGDAADVAAADGRLAVATSEDVLVVVDGEFGPTEFGPASAVAFQDGLVAAGDGRIAQYNPDSERWTTLCSLDAIRSIDGDLVAAESGVHRLDGSHVGLKAVTDVSTVGRPLAAAESGLYYLANSWMAAHEGAFTAVASRSDGLAHAATADTLFERETVDGRWTPVELPVDEPVADVDYAASSGDDGEVATYVVTQRGTVLVDAGEGWRSRSLGLPDVKRVAVVYG